jgi:hypothetical protein
LLLKKLLKKLPGAGATAAAALRKVVDRMSPEGYM